MGGVLGTRGYRIEMVAIWSAGPNYAPFHPCHSRLCNTKLSIAHFVDETGDNVNFSCLSRRRRCPPILIHLAVKTQQPATTLTNAAMQPPPPSRFTRFAEKKYCKPGPPVNGQPLPPPQAPWLRRETGRQGGARVKLSPSHRKYVPLKHQKGPGHHRGKIESARH